MIPTITVTFTVLVCCLKFMSVNGVDPPSTGLYFLLGNTINFPGDTVNINDIGEQLPDRNDPGMTLVCVATNVNSACCRDNDNTNGGPLGDLLYPNKTSLSALSVIGNAPTILYTVRRTHQLRLCSRGSPTGPLGVYTCVVPDMNGVDVTADIILSNTSPATSTSMTVTSMTSTSPPPTTTSTPTIMMATTIVPTIPPSTVSSVTVTSSNPTGIAGESSITLTCTASISGTSTPMFTWTGPVTRGLVTGQGNGPTFTDTLILGRVREFHAGQYVCIVSIGESSRSGSTVLAVNVPSVSVTISQSSTPIALRSYTLTCVLSAPSSLELSSQSYQWLKNGVVQNGKTANILDLSPLQVSENNAEYKCRYTASSVYLNNNVERTSALHRITVTYSIPSAPTNVVGSPLTTEVTLTWSKSMLDFVTSYTISYTRTGGCSAALPGSRTANGSPYTITGLEENIQYQITIIAMNSGGMSSPATITTTTRATLPSCCIPQPVLQSVSTTSFTVTWDREPCLSRNGANIHYVARYRLSGSSDTLVFRTVAISHRIFTATSLTARTSYLFEVALVNNVGTGLYSSLTIETVILPFFGYIGSVIYSNNSLVNLNDMGVDDNALYCYTNLTTCCSSVDNMNRGGLGNWKFPNDTVLGDRSTLSIFFRTRATNAILLHRGSSATGPTGIYRCEVPDSQNDMQFVYFGIYDNNRGSPSVSSVIYNTMSGIVTCVSTGGPASSVTWSRSGSSYQQSKIVVDTVTATYHNLLSITSSQISDYSGTFNCTVSNIRGSSSMVTGPYEAIGISGVENLYAIDSSASVTCFSNLTVQSIQWVDVPPDNSMTSVGDSHEQVLTLMTISRALHGTVFTCEVVNLLPNGETNTSRASFTLNSDEIPPGPVMDVMVISLNDSSVMISWRSPNKPNGVITTYNVMIFKLEGNTEVLNMNTISDSQTTVMGFDLGAGIPYNISVAAVNSKGPGKLTSTIIFTRELVTTISPQIMISRSSGTTMTVSWTKLTLIEARGFISNYTIAYYPISMSRKRQSNIMLKVVSSESNSAIIDGLDENSAYAVQMSANTGAGEGPVGVPVSVSIIATNTEAITDGNNGGTGDTSGSSSSNTVIGVVVALLLAVVVVTVIIIAIVIIMRRHGKTKYTPNESVQFTKGSQYKPPLQVGTGNGKSAKDVEANSELDEEQTYENTAFLVKDRLKEVSLEDFGAHVSRMHADRDKWFEMEYTSIEKAPKFDHAIATIPDNRSRNRFGNIYPYDNNRVVLSNIPDVDHSDYINASYVDGYGRKKVYIAAQGPMENSVEDFWRMMWEDRVPTIVMLTRVFEGKRKCEEYWPENTSDPFVPCSGSSFVIELKSSLPFAEFVTKKMTITKTDEPDAPVQEVTLFHYLGWPDHGVPANAISMINFIKRVRKSHPYSKVDLMVVHCSAGVGRTGTFITLDYMLERIKSEKSINIYQFVSGLRKQRVLMVQTPTQYIFIHNALDELLTCGDTEVAAANMRIVIGKLSRPAKPGSSISGFQKQYETLENVTRDVRSVDFSQSVNAANAEKNRYDDKIPLQSASPASAFEVEYNGIHHLLPHSNLSGCTTMWGVVHQWADKGSHVVMGKYNQQVNHTRVRLRPAAAQGSDYINASFVEGYRQKAAYIATQGPLPSTVNDFWRMIWEYECRCIVMLCKSEEHGKEVCHRYWPLGKGSSETYGKLTVTLTDQKAFSEYVMRKLEISEFQPRMSVTPTSFSVTQFQYLRWPEESAPNSTSTILEIANLVQKVQMSTGNKSIIVMCNDGIGRSGTFICMHAQMERMKSEAVVDVFQFIKSVRFQRAGLVANRAQYEFTHQVLADFLDGFETYANFKDII